MATLKRSLKNYMNRLRLQECDQGFALLSPTDLIVLNNQIISLGLWDAFKREVVVVVYESIAGCLRKRQIFISEIPETIDVLKSLPG